MEIGRFLLLDISWFDLHCWNNRFDFFKFSCIWIKLFLKKENMTFWLLDREYHQSQVNSKISLINFFIFEARNLFFKFSDLFFHWSISDFFLWYFIYMYTWWCYLIPIFFRFDSSNPSFSFQNLLIIWIYFSIRLMTIKLISHDSYGFSN